MGAIASICSFTHSSGEGRQSGKVQVQVSWYCGGRTWLDSHLWYSVQQNRLPKEIQWNLSNMDTLGTKMIVLISDEARGEYEVGIWPIVLLDQVSPFHRCPVKSSSSLI